MDTKKASGQSTKIFIVVGIIVIALLAAIVVILLGRQPQAAVNDGNPQKIGYSAEAKVMLDENTLQAAIDEAVENAKNGMVALSYQNDAYSKDGKTFSCYIANDAGNLYDMFVAIYADSGLTDQIFLSGLIPPGSGFEEITLDHALESGDHRVYVAVTQVETDEETGEQVLGNQVMHTIEFHVE